MNGDEDDVIKIASANGGGTDCTTRGVPGRDDASPPRSCSDRLQLSDWTGRVTASAPLLPSDVVVCLGTCRNGGYQTTTTTTTTNGTLVPPPSYDESVCRCIQPALSAVPRCHRHHPDFSDNDLLTAHAAQLNYYTNRTQAGSAF